MVGYRMDHRFGHLDRGSGLDIKRELVWRVEVGGLYFGMGYRRGRCLMQKTHKLRICFRDRLRVLQVEDTGWVPGNELTPQALGYMGLA